MLAHAPGEEEAAEFLGGGRTPGDDVQLRLGDSGGVGILKEQAAGDVFDDRSWWGGFNLYEAKVLFCGKEGVGFRGEGGGGDGFDEELGDFGCGAGIYFPIDANDASKGGDGIASEGFPIGVKD